MRRSLYLIPVFFGITLLVFSIERLAGDPVQIATFGNPRITEAQRQIIRQYFGLDKPVYLQYLHWLSELLVLNLGSSFTGGSVSALISQGTWATLEIQLLGLVLSLVIAIPIGILSAKRRYSAVDVTLSSSALVGTSIPI